MYLKHYKTLEHNPKNTASSHTERANQLQKKKEPSYVKS